MDCIIESLLINYMLTFDLTSKRNGVRFNVQVRDNKFQFLNHIRTNPLL